MTDDGLSRLVGMQRSDGGWGWWAGSAESDPYMTAYVVYGLATAKQAGVAVPPDVLARGYAYLAQMSKTAMMSAIWPSGNALRCRRTRRPSPLSARHVVHVAYSERDKLSAYGQALAGPHPAQPGRKRECRRCLPQLAEHGHD